MTNSHDPGHGGAAGGGGHEEHAEHVGDERLHAVDPPREREFWLKVLLESGEFGLVHLGGGFPTRVMDERQLEEILAGDGPHRLSAYAVDRLYIDHAVVTDEQLREVSGGLPDDGRVGPGRDVGLGSVQLHRVIGRVDAYDVLGDIFDLHPEHDCETSNIGTYDDTRGEPEAGHPAWLSTAYRNWSHSHWGDHTEWASHSHWTEEAPDIGTEFPDLPPGFDIAPAAAMPRPWATTIAVIDTGVDFGWEVDIFGVPVLVKPHEWFPQTYVAGTREQSRLLTDWPSGHGTVVTGIIRKCAPGHRVWVSSVDFDSNTKLTHEDAVIKAIDELPPSCYVLNLSFGGEGFGCNGPLYRKLHVWARNGEARDQRWVVAAAGNREEPSDFGMVSRPAAFDCVHAVAAGKGVAKGDEDSYYSWSNGGSWVDIILRVDNGAEDPNPPDELRRIYSCAPFDANGEVRFSSSYGTSVVTPLVTAEFALGNRNPVADNGHIRRPKLV